MMLFVRETWLGMGFVEFCPRQSPAEFDAGVFYYLPLRRWLYSIAQSSAAKSLTKGYGIARSKLLSSAFSAVPKIPRKQRSLEAALLSGFFV
jgi:hypothetical protein